MKTTSYFSDVMDEIDAKLGVCAWIEMPFWAIWHSVVITLLLNSEQVMSGHEDVRQGGHHEQAVAVLLQAAIAHLGKSEDALDDQEGMLDLGPYLRFGSVLLPRPMGKRIVPAALLVGKVLALKGRLSDLLFLAGVGRVTIDSVLVAMKKMRGWVLVMHVSRSGDDRMDQLGLGIDAYVGLHAEVPLVAFFCLVHLGVTGLVLDFGRGWGTDDRCIDDRAGGDLESIGLKLSASFIEHPLAQIMLLQQMAEFADGRPVWGALSAEINANKVVHRQRVIHSLFYRGGADRLNQFC